MTFDVFLSHNSRDKAAVRALASELKKRELTVWLDEWELRPGQPWQTALETIVRTAKAAAVIVGKDGVGPWQDQEMRGCLDEFVRRGLPVIPVLLPGVRATPELPLFLKGFTWVDMRTGLSEDGLKRLVWGITGHRLTDHPVSHQPASRVRWRLAVFGLLLLVAALGYVYFQRHTPQQPDLIEDHEDGVRPGSSSRSRPTLEFGVPVSAQDAKPARGEYRVPADAKRIVVELTGAGGGGGGGGGGIHSTGHHDSYASGAGGGGGGASQVVTCDLVVVPGEVYEWQLGEGGLGGKGGAGATNAVAEAGKDGHDGTLSVFSLVADAEGRSPQSKRGCRSDGAMGGAGGGGGLFGTASTGGVGGHSGLNQKDGGAAGADGQRFGGGGGGNGAYGGSRDPRRVGKNGGDGSRGTGGKGGIRGNTAHEEGTPEDVAPTGGGGGGGAVAVASRGGAQGGQGGRPFQAGVAGAGAQIGGAGGGGGGGAGGNGSAPLKGGDGGQGGDGWIRRRVYRR